VLRDLIHFADIVPVEGRTDEQLRCAALLDWVA
jgi:hypothetical protein